MRMSRIREADGTVTAAQCRLCGAEIYGGGAYYQVNGQVFCPDCLEEYARGYFAPFLCEGGEDTWR